MKRKGAKIKGASLLWNSGNTLLIFENANEILLDFHMARKAGVVRPEIPHHEIIGDIPTFKLARVAAIYWVFSMPSSARIDAPGPEAHHHIIARGIDRRKISDDDADRDAFLERLEIVLSQSGASCYAWALIPNHHER